MNRADRFNEAVAYLKGQQIIKTNKEIASRMKASESTISLALKGSSKHLTDSFLSRFIIAFQSDITFNPLWISGEYEDEPMILIQSDEESEKAPNLPGIKHIIEEPSNPYYKLTQMERLLKAQEDVINSKNETIDSLKREIELLRMQLGLENKQTKVG
nr:hypothetical protein [uncultured Draconibacterium sp.]